MWYDGIRNLHQFRCIMVVFSINMTKNKRRLRKRPRRIWKRVSACRMFVVNRSTVWTGPLSTVDEDEEVLCNTWENKQRATSCELRALCFDFSEFCFRCLRYSDQGWADGDRLSTEGYCHWGKFLIRVINGYGERRLPANEQHVKKQKGLGPGFGCWFISIGACPVTGGIVADIRDCAETCGYPER